MSESGCFSGSGAEAIRVAVLCAREDSVYKGFEGVEVYDKVRDARIFSEGFPVVAHPPCRGWGRLSYFAKASQEELDLGPLCVSWVRKNGGVLEHPAHSKLWRACGLPEPRAGMDSFRGATLCVPQFWFGHRAEKLSWFYIVGVRWSCLPPISFRLGEASHVIASSRVRRIDGSRMRKGDEAWRPAVTKAEREHTPVELARWLLAVARESTRRNWATGDLKEVAE